MIKKKLTGLKLNLGCGRNTKKGWINVDIEERENKLDLVCDLSHEFPFKNNSCQYVYAEHFIEHLNWLAGRQFLENCYRVLMPGGTLRLVFPDYRRIFRAYVSKNTIFFQTADKSLNMNDYPYYKSVFENPEKICKTRKKNPPPKWHLSHDPKDRNKLQERVRKYSNLIEYVDWYVYQYGEHRCLYDEELLKNILLEIGFRKTYKSHYDSEIDMKDIGGRISCCVEGIK